MSLLGQTTATVRSGNCASSALEAGGVATASIPGSARTSQASSNTVGATATRTQACAVWRLQPACWSWTLRLSTRDLAQRVRHLSGPVAVMAISLTPWTAWSTCTYVCDANCICIQQHIANSLCKCILYALIYSCLLVYTVHGPCGLYWYILVCTCCFVTRRAS